MDTFFIQSSSGNPDFSEAKDLADNFAASKLEIPVLLSWHDQIRNKEYPSGVSECHEECDTPGCITYAENRGGILIIDVNRGEYLFCYRELGEFAE